MNKPINKGGRPPRAEQAATKSLGSVRLTELELDECTQAAELEGQPRTVWIRTALAAAAKRVRKKHGISEQ